MTRYQTCARYFHDDHNAGLAAAASGSSPGPLRTPTQRQPSLRCDHRGNSAHTSDSGSCDPTLLVSAVGVTGSAGGLVEVNVLARVRWDEGRLGCVESVYLSPETPCWAPRSEADLGEAAQQGLLEETQLPRREAGSARGHRREQGTRPRSRVLRHRRWNFDHRTRGEQAGLRPPAGPAAASRAGRADRDGGPDDSRSAAGCALLAYSLRPGRIVRLPGRAYPPLARQPRTWSSTGTWASEIRPSCTYPIQTSGACMSSGA